jgi:beta-glucosidase
MACVKHLAANSIEKARFRVDVRLSERALREVYLPHFRRCVDEGVAAVMSAYNRVNGAYCSENRHLLRDILKGEWGFSGLVMSDFLYAVHDAKAAIEAGLDLEMPFARHYGRRLLRLVERGEVSEAYIDDAVRRVLRQKIRFAQVGEPARYRLEAVAGPEHRALARLVAQKAIVLLKNEPVADWGAPLLPLDPGRVRRLAVIDRRYRQQQGATSRSCDRARRVKGGKGLRSAVRPRRPDPFCGCLGASLRCGGCCGGADAPRGRRVHAVPSKGR